MMARTQIRRSVLLVGALVAGLLMGACSATPEVALGVSASGAAGTRPPGQESLPAATGSGPDAGDPYALPSTHVHAIARDPGSGKVLVAAHDGLYVYDGATPRRVGPVLDLMGFTVAGPGHYYASGHPGTASDLPQPLGLIESRDGGVTWQVLSRGGASDFHSLTTAGTTVVGFDGVLRSTTDGRTWATGRLGPEPRTLAGSRTAATVLATTQQGVMRSPDGGATWQMLESAPLLLMAAFGEGDSAAGLAPDGQLYLSADAGESWRATALRVPAAQAVHVSGEGEELEVLVASGKALLASTGGGPFQPVR